MANPYFSLASSLLGKGVLGSAFVDFSYIVNQPEGKKPISQMELRFCLCNRKWLPTDLAIAKNQLSDRGL
jgi:hypothetical protein